jgi:uncharacterized Zn-binding protein involved in type VI secretion
MRILGWIRVGDKAACGGAVAEGFDGTRYNGIPYSFKGARMNCAQQCIIAEAIEFFKLPNGLHVPHHGHRTSAGCPLHSTANDKCGFSNIAGIEVPAQYVTDSTGGWLPCSHGSPYDLSFEVREMNTGKPIINTPYRIVLESGPVVEGCTDTAGRTAVIHSGQREQATITVPYYADVSTPADPSIESGPCDH